ncbi:MULTISPECIES: DUF732 domain-containing protein [Mycobacterium]|uniref:DUF732 domain-containing protein n=1 Tax=Mycobacterium TaxID=1763 RepID=UPI001CD9FF48|nr:MULTISPECIES: DUF732 domain-containing protein [Mycobacterium]MCA2243525.1 DUF732 domain-containing protein [Mycobacterium sp. WUMAC-067]MCA2316471.1 DUF732 domain-containing protein [Mycobacterium sp. WUMAC-025]MEE3750811.1 DUF732 domain-containing protein [Mycobacterium intracellulare]
MTSTQMRKPGRARSLLAIGVAPVAGLLGALSTPASAHATSADEAFLAALKAKGINFESPEAVVNSGHTVCHQLDSGQTPEQVANNVLSSSSLDGYHAGYFVGVSIKAYCPKYAAASGS